MGAVLLRKTPDSPLVSDSEKAENTGRPDHRKQRTTTQGTCIWWVVTPILGDVQEAPDHSEWDMRLGRVSGKETEATGRHPPPTQAQAITAPEGRFQCLKRVWAQHRPETQNTRTSPPVPSSFLKRASKIVIVT